jgi:hypothetical protein
MKNIVFGYGQAARPTKILKLSALMVLYASFAIRFMKGFFMVHFFRAYVSYQLGTPPGTSITMLKVLLFSRDLL